MEWVVWRRAWDEKRQAGPSSLTLMALDSRAAPGIRGSTIIAPSGDRGDYFSWAP